MRRQEQQIYDRLRQEKLPPGWTCEKAWPYEDHTHLVAPQKSGGVIVEKWRVVVQLPGTGPSRPVITIGYDYLGRGWLDRLVADAMKAVRDHADKFPKGEHLQIRGKLGTHATNLYAVRCTDGDRLDGPPSVGDVVEVQSESDTRVSKWSPVLVDEIKFGDYYYLSLR